MLAFVRARVYVMTAPKRTPGPWRVSSDLGAFNIDGEYNGDGQTSPSGTFMVAHCPHSFALHGKDEAEANAAFIVEACNAHDSLVAQRDALAEALRRIEEHEYRADRRHRGMVDESEIQGLMRTARAALAALEGKGE